MKKCVARSASDKTDDWPFWIVWDGSFNGTIEALEMVFDCKAVGMPFLPKKQCEILVELLNEMGGH